jgi:uncharacterized protein HemX
MAEGRSRTPRIRMPKVSLPGRSRSGGKSRPSKSEAPTKTAATAKEGGGGTKSGAAAKATEPKPAASRKTPAPDLQERMEGLQGWMAEIERKQGRMTYFGAAGVLIAILAAGAGLYFGITAKSDSAKKSDVDALTTKVDSLEAAVTKNSKATQATLNDTVTRLQASIAAVQKQQAQNAANISTLQAQVASGALSKKGAGALGTGTGTGTTTTTPGAKTKTTP